ASPPRATESAPGPARHRAGASVAAFAVSPGRESFAAHTSLRHHPREHGGPMPVFKLVRRVKFPAAAVWPVLSDVVGFGELSPNLSRCEIISGERVGMRRRNWDADNRMWDEICIEWNDARSYTMLVDTGDYPYPY